MKKISDLDKADRKILYLGIGIILAIFLLGLFALQKTVKTLEQHEKNNLLLRAGTIALSLNPEEVDSLDGKKSDLPTENYQTLKRSLTSVRALNQDIRFVYIMGLKDDRPFFYLDSEDPSSSDYSYPGQPYDDFYPKEVRFFKEGKAYTMGPYTDDWGEWYSALAPVVADDNEIIGMVGIDTAAEDLRQRMVLVEAAGFVIIGLVCLCATTILSLLLKSRNRENG